MPRTATTDTVVASEGNPKSARLGLREAHRNLPGPGERGFLHAVGLRAAEVAHGEPQRATDRCVGLDVTPEASGAGVDPEFFTYQTGGFFGAWL